MAADDLADEEEEGKGDGEDVGADGEGEGDCFGEGVRCYGCRRGCDGGNGD